MTGTVLCLCQITLHNWLILSPVVLFEWMCWRNPFVSKTWHVLASFPSLSVQNCGCSFPKWHDKRSVGTWASEHSHCVSLQSAPFLPCYAQEILLKASSSNSCSVSYSLCTYADDKQESVLGNSCILPFVCSLS